MNSDNHLLNFQSQLIVNFTGCSGFSDWAYSWLRIFCKFFLPGICSTSLQFILWILRTKTLSGGLCTVTHGIFSNSSFYVWWNVQCILPCFLNWGCSFQFVVTMVWYLTKPSFEFPLKLWASSLFSFAFKEKYEHYSFLAIFILKY